MTGRAHGIGLLVAVATLGTLMWDVERPALWIDECASVVATQRTWPNLWLLLGGAEAPLVPYYALLKLARSAVSRLSPWMVANPELIFRLPSLIAAVLAAWILTVWLARRWPITLALGTATALLVTGGFSRYGQEARPYALALLAAVIATITWATMVSDPRRRWIGLYALSVALLVTTHLLAGSLVAAHLIAALIAPPDIAPPDIARPDAVPPETTAVWAQRRSALVRTVIGAALGLAIVAPFAGPASAHGVGPPKDSPLTWTYLSTTFLNLFTEGAGFTTSMNGGPLFGIGLLLLVAAIGLAQVFLRRYRFIARVAATWALVPPLVLLPVVTLRPNLGLGRYLVFIIPGWAILAGLGVVTVADVVRHLSGRNVTVRTVTGGLAAILVLTAMVISQTSTLTGVREPGGHSEDIRPALALADRPEYVSLPIVMAAPLRSLEIAVYHREDEPRLLGARIPRDQESIWPIDSHLDARQQASRYPRIVVLVRAPSTSLKCPGPSLADYVWHCMPKWLRQEGYRVEMAENAGYKWTFAVVARAADEQETVTTRT